MQPSQATISTALHPVLAQAPGHLVWRAHARVSVALDEVLPEGVDIHAYAVLLALAGDVTRSQQELADSVGISRTTMARVAVDLAAAGLVERVRNPDDRRSYALTRTDAGASAATDWQHHADALQDSLLAGFTPAEQGDLQDLLLRVVDAEIAPDAPPELRRSIGFVISRAHFHMHRDFLAELVPLELEPRLFGSLNVLTATGPIPQAELARLLGVSGASIVQMADQMEQLGLLERRRDPADRRTQLLHLTPAAEPVLPQAREIAAHCLGHRLGPLSDVEGERLVQLLPRFVTSA
ncbi:hypothetical protein BH11ACT8_BH11ACT8_16960 [soil metagenome]